MPFFRSLIVGLLACSIYFGLALGLAYVGFPGLGRWVLISGLFLGFWFTQTYGGRENG